MQLPLVCWDSGGVNFGAPGRRKTMKIAIFCRRGHKIHEKMNKSTQSDHFEAISAPEATIFGPKSTLWAPKSQKKKSENLWRLQGGLPTPHGTRF